MDVFGCSPESKIRKLILDIKRATDKELISHDKSIAKNREKLETLNTKLESTTNILTAVNIQTVEMQKRIENLIEKMDGTTHFMKEMETKFYGSLSLNNMIIDEMRENVLRLTIQSESTT